MASSATEWAWANSRASNGSLIVLLAIADEIDRNGAEVEMSVTQIAGKCRLGDRATRDAVKALERLGELSVTPRAGGIGSYRLSTTPAESAGPPLSTPADIAGPPRQNLPDLSTIPLEKSAGPVDNSEEKPQVRATPAESAGPEISDMFVVPTGRSLAGVKDVPAKPAPTPPRDDVDRLCEHLADRITGNGSRRPTITKKWRDAARLLIDKDGMTEQQVHSAIDWCQNHEFWRGVVLSMPKLREKYDQLRQQARRQPKVNGANHKLGIVASFLERAGDE